MLAQLKREYGSNREAIELFEEIVKLKTPYEMEFQARMQQALAFDRRRGDSMEIKELFFDMLEEDKNEAYRDQIYYALAQIELEELNREEGMDYLRDALAENSGNRRPRMKSFLGLADLHLEDREYELAQAYYDSTLANMDEDHPRYQEVSNNAKSLTELVEQLMVIVRNDSLRDICNLDEDARYARMEDIIEGLRIAQEAAEAEAERLAEEALAESMAVPGAATAFWPYNPTLRDKGQRDFFDQWGDRPLEDDWRRSRKMAAGFGTIEEVADDVASVDLLGAGGELPTPEELLETLPCSVEEQATADVETATAVYQSGVIYKEKLDDTDNAIEAWIDLLDRYEESAEHPLAHYQLYRTYLFLEETENYQNPFCETCNSQYWADQISLLYPDSEWAQLVEDPDFVDFEEQRRMDELAAYEAHLIRYYSQKDYQELLTEINALLDTVPNHTQGVPVPLPAGAVHRVVGWTGPQSGQLHRGPAGGGGFLRLHRAENRSGGDSRRLGRRWGRQSRGRRRARRRPMQCLGFRTSETSRTSPSSSTISPWSFPCRRGARTRPRPPWPTSTGSFLPAPG